MSDTDDRQKIIDLVGRANSAMLTTMTADGRHVSRPMGVQEVEFDGDLWFFSSTDTDKARQIAANPEVNVSFSNDKQSEWTSVAGTAEVVTDRGKAEQLWSKPLEAWFPDGLDTPGLGLIRVHAETVEYWDASSSRVKQVLGMVQAIRHDDPDRFPVENRTVEL